MPEQPETRQALDGRRGAVFSVRLTAEEKRRAVELQGRIGGPRELGAWLRWRALAEPGELARGQLPLIAPGSAAPGSAAPGSAAPGSAVSSEQLEIDQRVILDLCAGSGAWSSPYVAAGYHVIRVTLPEADVRTWRPPPGLDVWGVLAAPPCTEFSMARNLRPSKPRDPVEGMACVNACLRIILQTAPRWWALENPTGYLSETLGTPRDVFEPCEFGDPWTKETALWGNFALPVRGPFVEPSIDWMAQRSAAARAVTPSGFARAFFEANR